MYKNVDLKKYFSLSVTELLQSQSRRIRDEIFINEFDDMNCPEFANSDRNFKFKTNVYYVAYFLRLYDYNDYSYNPFYFRRCRCPVLKPRELW